MNEKFEVVELGVASEVTKTSGPGPLPDEFNVPTHFGT